MVYYSSSRDISTEVPPGGSNSPNSSKRKFPIPSYGQQGAKTSSDVALALRTHSLPPSKVILALTASQSSLALISALLSGLSFQALMTVKTLFHPGLGQLNPGGLSESHWNVASCTFSVATSLTVSISLFIAVSCTILQQSGQVANSLASKSGAPSNFDSDLEDWYNEKSFQHFRHRLFYLFILSFPIFAVSASAMCQITMTSLTGKICSVIFGMFGLWMLRVAMMLNGSFVEGVLKKSKGK